MTIPKMMIYKLANRKMANGLAFCSHVQEMHAKESTAASFVHKLSTTMLRSFHRSLFEELVDDHQSYARWYPSGIQVSKDSR